jgi:hypothetical protein
VFVNGENFTGQGPLVESSGFFDEVLTDILAPQLSAHANALVIPLGDFVTRVLQRLVTSGVLHEEQCLFRFPHPSGANGHKWKRGGEERASRGDGALPDEGIARSSHDPHTWAASLTRAGSARAAKAAR